jgi:hypothetical protein
MAQKKDLSLAKLSLGRDDICPDCSNLDEKCVICSFVNNCEQMKNSINVVKENLSLKPLYELIAKLGADNIIANNAEGQRVINKLKKLATGYKLLEAKTRRLVMKIQSYGEDCQKAAEDFLTDGFIGDLLAQLRDIEDAKAALEDANDMHTVLE